MQDNADLTEPSSPYNDSIDIQHPNHNEKILKTFEEIFNHNKQVKMISEKSFCVTIPPSVNKSIIDALYTNIRNAGENIIMTMENRTLIINFINDEEKKHTDIVSYFKDSLIPTFATYKDRSTINYELIFDPISGILFKNSNITQAHLNGANFSSLRSLCQRKMRGMKEKYINFIKFERAHGTQSADSFFIINNAEAKYRVKFWDEIIKPIFMLKGKDLANFKRMTPDYFDEIMHTGKKKGRPTKEYKGRYSFLSK